MRRLCDLKSYFAAAAFNLALSRDLYLDAVFLWIVPFCTALSITDAVALKLLRAALRSPFTIDSRNPRSAVRSRDLFARFTNVRFSV